MTDTDIKKKYASLLALLKSFESISICYSGGVDSTLLLAASREALGDRVLAVTADSSVHPAAESAAARDMACRLGVEHIVFPSREMQAAVFLENSRDRCYHCKRLLLSDIIRISRERGISVIAHGANRDDLQDFRPGSRAAEEFGIQAPLVDAGMTKSDIRRLSKDLKLPTWDRPAMPCLATRIPYGVRITEDLLRRIENAEAKLEHFGFAGVRVRIAGSGARIELQRGDIEKAAAVPLVGKIVQALKKAGFTSVSLDLEAYRQGSMNTETD